MEQAALAEPLSVLLHASRRAGFTPGTPWTVLVFGVGAIGLLACALAKSYGATRVVAIDINQARLDFARAQGFAEKTFCLPAADKAKTTEEQLRRAKDSITAALAHFDMQDGFDLVTRLLTYEPTARLPAAHALGHPLFRRGLPLVLPPSLGGKPWQGRSLANVISQYIGSVG